MSLTILAGSFLISAIRAVAANLTIAGNLEIFVLTMTVSFHWQASFSTELLPIFSDFWGSSWDPRYDCAFPQCF